MPIYEFICQDCQCEQELLVRGEASVECEACGSSALQKLLSVPAVPATGGGTASRAGGDGPPAGSCGSGCGCHPS